eukprot:5742617-Pyramimonas_sp.AAC.1
MKDIFQLYVYTMGDKLYAHAMASLLDTSGKLFKNRIVSQSDSTQRRVKDLDVIMLRGADELVLIMDDTQQVWANNKDNLLTVERYHYFPSSANQFRVKGQSLVDRGVDENEQEGQLAALVPVLRDVHRQFFENVDKGSTEPGDRDVRELTQRYRRKILAGVVIVFSRVFPLEMKRPEDHHFWRMAVSMGAVCSKALTPETTHLVATSSGTDKVRQALAEGKMVVSPRWIECCSVLWKRAEESQFVLP